MDYRIIKKGSFKVIGKVTKLSAKYGEHHMEIAEFWDECNTDRTTEKINAIDNRQNMLGICMNYKEQISYMIAIENVNNLRSTEFDTRKIPAATWAVFTSVGPLPNTIIDLWSKIFQEWFQATGFEQGNAPMLEVYPPGNTSALDYKCEAWVPINNMIPVKKPNGVKTWLINWDIGEGTLPA
ncbi:MAG TPA: GyrI-like domain-containing protein [Desulfosporosinus sp.]|nr:GyrI-like domain-containing protein [Desulfosporosinus sp.]